MSSIVISGDTSGAITLSAPAVAGTNTLTLPAVTGTIVTNKTTGTILQVVTATDAGSGTTSTTAINLNVATVNITPLSTNSKIIIQVSFQGTITAAGVGTNSYGNYQINEGATARGTTYQFAVVSGTGTNVQTVTGQTISVALANTSVATRGFTIYGYSSTASATMSATGMVWTIMEVAA
jgi:hypothetical protein